MSSRKKVRMHLGLELLGMKLVLEPRYLFDGSIAAVIKPVVDAGHAEPTVQGADNTAVLAHVLSLDTAATAPAADVPGLDANPGAHQLLFVDPRVANWQSLAGSVSSGTQVLVLDPGKDAVAQITQSLANRTGVETIGILAYGSAGQVEIGNTAFDAAAVNAHAADIAHWSDHLATGASIQFWGCDVGAGTSGQALLTDLHSLTGAHIMASDSAIGATALGGRWTLDVSDSGALAPGAIAAPFDAVAEAAYSGVLDAPVPTVTISGAPSNVLLGASFTETVTLSNIAAHASGSGAYIEVFAPANSTETATLTAATYDGQSLSIASVTLQSDGAGHVFAADPHVPAMVDAPTGFQAGDRMYIIDVPVAGGSLAAGAKADPVLLNFQLANKGAVTTTGGLAIAAIGGFVDNGGVAVRGTNPAEGALATDTGNGLAVANSNVTLLSAEAAITYVSANIGTSSPTMFQVTLNSAPALAVNPLHNFAYSVALPTGAEYDGGAIDIAGIGALGATASIVSTGSGQVLEFAIPELAAGATTFRLAVHGTGSAMPGGSILPSVADPTVTVNGIYPLTGDTKNTATYQATAWDASTGAAVSLPQFDTALGTLNSVQLSFTAYTHTDASIINTGAAGSITKAVLSERVDIFAPGTSGASLIVANNLLEVNPQSVSITTKTSLTAGATFVLPTKDVNATASLGTPITDSASAAVWRTTV